MAATREVPTGTWSWRDGVVEATGDHLELLYGSQDADPSSWVGVVRVGPPRGRVFPVRWLIDREVSANRVILEGIRKELNWLLLEVGPPEPWAYAQHHCGTTSNWYGFFHWSSHVRAKRVAKQRRRRS